MAENLVEKHMRILGCTEEEALELIEFDKSVDRMSMKQLNAEMTPEQKAAMKQAHKGDRKPTVYQFSKRERKANPTKGSIIAEIAKFLEENSENACENVTITNKERQIAFKIGENDYEITLIQKRKPKN